MRFVLEGPDNSGKTTLARELADNVPATTYFMAGDPPRDWNHEQECVKQQRDILAANASILMDRVTCISQMVYNPDESLRVYRLKGLSEILKMGAILVFCRPSSERLSRTDEFTWREGETEEHRQKIIQNQMTFVARYDRLMANFPCLMYDFESSSAATLRALMIESLNGSAEASRKLYATIRLGARTW